MTSIDIPNGVTTIVWNAFYYCTKLTTVLIPNSVTYIGSTAFFMCPGLTSVAVEWNTSLTIDSNVFDFVDKSSCTLFVLAGTKEAYQSAAVWNDFENIVEVEDYLLEMPMATARSLSAMSRPS